MGVATRGRASISLTMGDAMPLERWKGFMLHYRGLSLSFNFGLSLGLGSSFFVMPYC